MKRKLLLCFIVLPFMMACEAERLMDNNPAKKYVEISTKIESQTRINSTETGDKFSTGDVIAVSNGSAFVDYVYNEGNIWGPVSSDKQLTWDDPEMTFSAYHPSTEGTSMTSFVLPTDQSNLAKISQAEYQLADAKNYTSDAAVTLNFRRRIARIILSIDFVGGLGDDKEVKSIRIASAASQYKNSIPVEVPTFITPYSGEGEKYIALLIPTTNPASSATFIELTTVSGITYTLSGIPAMLPGKSYAYRVTARNTSPHKLELASVDVADWENEPFLDGYIRRYAVTLGEGAPTEYYAVGDSVGITAAFIEKMKFDSWTVSTDTRANSEVQIKDPKSAFTSFIMPARDVKLTANYVEAPYKLIIKKPGVIMEGDEKAHTALVQETDTTTVRYYAQNDMVRISTLDTEFEEWNITDSSKMGHFYYQLNGLGGGQKWATWFKMPQYEVELHPKYKVVQPPYWSSQPTQKGWMIANFIERVNPFPNTVTIPGGGTLYRAFTEEERAAIMRGMNAIENTFAIPPRRTIVFNFAVVNWVGSNVAAATEPVAANAGSGFEPPRTHWLSSDFEGIATGRLAYSSNVAAAWRDQINVNPYGASDNNSFIGYRDGTILVNAVYLPGWYKGEDPNKIPPGGVDFQSMMMHEMGHLICYHSSNGRSSQLGALDVFVANKNDYSKNLLNGNMYSTGGDAIIYNDFVKSFLGYYLPVVGGADNAFDFGHLFTAPGLGVGSQYRAGGRTTRKFADFELAFLQEMGWKINPEAWSQSQNPVLSKSTSNVRLSGDAGTFTVTVSNTGTGSMKWKLSKSDDWIVHLSSASGVLTKGESQTVTISYQALATGERTATITLSSSTPSVAAANAIQEISITQEAK